MKKVLLALFVMFFAAQTWAAVDAAAVPEKKQTPQGLYLSAKDAHDMVQKDAAKVLFIDVRTQAEVEFVGMSTMVDANIPYMISNVAEWDAKKNVFAKTPNSGFQAAVEAQLKKKGLSKSDSIIVMCRSGDRSAKAAALLAKLGYSNVYSVVDGFEGDTAKDGAHKGERVVNGWKNAGLPWSYKLDKAKMYLEF
ncbi:MAG: sulfurtransferase [Gammaproteobacteria bacterium HGW-Gammaproteobacteria-1]|jgi:rhodanese-related sulfurtransferase|nr:MAG: sulfurtransferase [Gammaproteobacteria bacterium HGW-Gammaproteobacteria-1]